MKPTREEALLALALAKPATERVAWLDRECADDAQFRQRRDQTAVHPTRPERQ